MHQQLKYHSIRFNTGHLATLFVSVTLLSVKATPNLLGCVGLSSFPPGGLFKLSTDIIPPLLQFSASLNRRESPTLASAYGLTQYLLSKSPSGCLQALSVGKLAVAPDPWGPFLLAFLLPHQISPIFGDSGPPLNWKPAPLLSGSQRGEWDSQNMGSHSTLRLL